MISVDQLSISYDHRIALSNASLEARPGQVLALVGPSGSGKSSLLLALNRMLELIPGAQTNGEIRFDGIDIREAFTSASELRRHVGLIFQKPNPFAMSIRLNMQMAVREHGIRNRKVLHEIMEQALREVGLWEEVHDRLDQSALELSGGQQQRLCIARALALRPKVLLLDEPCSALDPISAERVEQLIRTLGKQFTVVMVTHNLAQAKRLSQRMAVFWMRDGVGEIVEVGDTHELFEQSQNEIVTAYLTGQTG